MSMMVWGRVEIVLFVWLEIASVMRSSKLPSPMKSSKFRPLLEGAVSGADWGSSWMLETTRYAERC
ncbi:MAG: hypothetical protein MSA50_02095 [Veillonellaceae bacterium]|nr:hypothetical protein [Veillonellaceae bacterium]